MLAAHPGMEASAGMRKRALKGGGGPEFAVWEVRKLQEFCWGEFKAELHA